MGSKENLKLLEINENAEMFSNFETVLNSLSFVGQSCLKLGAPRRFRSLKWCQTSKISVLVSRQRPIQNEYIVRLSF